LLVAKTESDLQLFGNPLWVEIDSDLPENALAGADYQFTGANSIDFQPPGAWLRQHSDVIAQKP
jgi:hypothetical protein